MSARNLACDPRAVRVSKLPLPVGVRFATEDGICATREGAVSYRRGDAILEGPDGEHWPVQAARFAETYEPLPSTCAGDDGTYRRRSGTLLARRLDRPVTVRAGANGDPLQGEAGDWLVQYGPDEYGIVAASIFARTYVLAEPE